MIFLICVDTGLSQFEDQETERNGQGRYNRQTPVGKEETCGEGSWQKNAIDRKVCQAGVIVESQ